jgi:hypothetical protein
VDGDHVKGTTTYLDGHIEGTIKGEELEFTLTLSNGWVSKFRMKLEGGPNALFGYSIGVQPESRAGVKESSSWERTGN